MGMDEDSHSKARHESHAHMALVLEKVQALAACCRETNHCSTEASRMPP